MRKRTRSQIRLILGWSPISYLHASRLMISTVIKVHLTTISGAVIPTILDMSLKHGCRGFVYKGSRRPSLLRYLQSLPIPKQTMKFSILTVVAMSFLSTAMAYNPVGQPCTPQGVYRLAHRYYN